MWATGSAHEARAGPRTYSRRHYAAPSPPVPMADRYQWVIPVWVDLAAALADETEPFRLVAAARSADLILGRCAAWARRDHSAVNPKGRHGASPRPRPKASMAKPDHDSQP